MKYFRMSYEEVVFRRSYINLILLNRAIPGFEPYDKKEKAENRSDNEKEINANDFFMRLM